MRKELERINGQRIKISATVKRYGTRFGWDGRVFEPILLMDIRDIDGNVLADYLCMNETRVLSRLDLVPGDTIEFESRLMKYPENYQGDELAYFEPIYIDAKALYPTKFNVVRRFGSVG